MMSYAGITGGLKDRPWHGEWHPRVGVWRPGTTVLGSGGYRGARLGSSRDIRPQASRGLGPEGGEVA